jgi:hypothetical protein
VHHCSFLANADIFGERPVSSAENLVTRLKLVDGSADLFDRRSIVLIVAVGAALAVPARAYAVDHLVLDISPTRVAAGLREHEQARTCARLTPQL